MKNTFFNNNFKTMIYYNVQQEWILKYLAEDILVKVDRMVFKFLESADARLQNGKFAFQRYPGL